MSVMEQYILQNKLESVAKHMFPFETENLHEGIALVKVLSSVLESVGFAPKIMDEIDLLKPDSFEKAKQEIIRQLTRAAVQGASITTEQSKVYSPTDVARMMGVSHTTISKYIAAGRFQGVERPEPGKHVEITGRTVLEYPNGETKPVYQIALEFKERMRRAEEEEQESEIVFIEKKIQTYQERYRSIEDLEKELYSGATLSNTSAALDLDVWKYFENRKNVLLG
jgi:predicted transcriptional regulator